MPDRKIGVQLYALRDAWAADPERTLQRIKAMGLDGVEAAGAGEPNSFRDERRARSRLLRERLDDAGLKLSGVHSVLPLADDADWLFEELAVLAAPIAISSTPERVLGFTRDVFDTRGGVLRLADRFNALVEIAAAHGIRLGYHNHWWEWASWEGDGEDAYTTFVEALDPRVALEIDLFWAQSAGQDLGALIARHGSRVEFVHVKDGDGRAGEPQVVAGAGDIRLDEALDAGERSITWQILEIDLVAPGVDVWEVIGGGHEWLRARRPGRPAHRSAVDAPRVGRSSRGQSAE